MQKDAVSWARDEIKTAELQRRLSRGKSTKPVGVTFCLYRAAVALREAFRSGLLK